MYIIYILYMYLYFEELQRGITSKNTDFSD